MHQHAEFDAYHFCFDKRLQGIHLAVILPLHQLDLTERTLSDDLDSNEVLWPLTSPQEAKEPHLCCLDILNLCLLLRLGDVRV